MLFLALFTPVHHKPFNLFMIYPVTVNTMKELTILFVMVLLAQTAFAAGELVAIKKEANGGAEKLASTKAYGYIKYSDNESDDKNEFEGEDEKDEGEDEEDSVERIFDASTKLKMQINPSTKYIQIGDKTVFEVILSDGHMPCSDLRECPVIKYSLQLTGIPYKTEYPQTVELIPGDVMRFKLVVDTSKSLPQIQTVNTLSTQADTVQISDTSDVRPSQRILAAKPYKMILYAFGDDVKVIADAMVYLGVADIAPIQPTKVVIPLSRGWNIVSLAGVSSNVLQRESNIDYVQSIEQIQTLEKTHKDKVFIVWLKTEKRYASFSEAAEIMGAKNLRSYLQYNGFWVNTPSDDELTFSVSRYASFRGMPVDGGWNFIPITHDLLGKSLGDVKNECIFKLSYLWDADGKKWVQLDESRNLKEKYLYSAIVALAVDECKLGINYDRIGSPPPLPEI